ncbi:MAG: tetratricopeptide repeat protein [Candidatus Eisenbacteria bacterium]
MLGNARQEFGRHRDARLHLEESLALARETGDEAGLGTALQSLGNLHLLQDEHERARALLTKAACSSSGAMIAARPHPRAAGGLVHREGDVARAQDLDERALAIYRRIET